MHFYALICVFLVVTLPGSLGRRCNSTRDCRCGEICVGGSNTVYCSYGERCSCRRGCAVAKIFLPAGTSQPDVYNNICSCPRSPSSSRTIPACTRRPWIGLPRNVPLYPGTVNC